MKRVYVIEETLIFLVYVMYLTCIYTFFPNVIKVHSRTSEISTKIEIQFIHLKYVHLYVFDTSEFLL